MVLEKLYKLACQIPIAVTKSVTDRAPMTQEV